MSSIAGIGCCERSFWNHDGVDRLRWFGPGNSALRIGHLDIANLLLKVIPAGTIRNAAAKGRFKVVERLLQDKRVDPTAENNYALRTVAFVDYI
jgi:hypothetical protein